MTFLKSALAKGLVTAALAGATLAATATTASAYVVCNRFGDCWHTNDRLAYPAGLGIVFHNDAWAAHRHWRHWHWRGDQNARGYYRNGIWITF